MSDRQQHISIGGVQFPTNERRVSGSILGPLLFSIVTTPVGDLIENFRISYHQYVDDAQLYTTIARCAANGFAELSACIDAITGWHLENYLLLNQQKIRQWSLELSNRSPDSISQPASWSRSHPYHLPLNCELLVSRLTVNLLSETTSPEWCTTATFTCIYALRHVRLMLTKEIANTLACVIVSAHFDYCNSILY